MRSQACTQGIRDFLVHAIASGVANPVRAATQKFGISRQAVNRHIRALARESVVLPIGATRARRYELAVTETERSYGLDEALDESRTWREFVRPTLAGLTSNAVELCHYAVTEIVNNAIEHSEGTFMHVVVKRSAAHVEIDVHDDGIGIFRKIRDALQLADDYEAVLELVKGKFTTDPKRHTGEGIFFASRMCNKFAIVSGTLFFSHRPDHDWLLESHEHTDGTAIQMTFKTTTSRTISEVFDRYASTDEEYRFAVTHVPVFLARLGEDNLISRSQAKRLVARFDRFDEVVLNFANVQSIGQAFADEVFRVFREEHPKVEIVVANAAPGVEKMIRRADAGADAPHLRRISTLDSYE